VIQSYTYTLGPTGNRTQITEAGGTVRAYQYDSLYRLTQDKVTVGGALLYQKDFTYDPVGNRLAQTTTGLGAASVSYAYDSRDRLLTENATAYGWDTNGNLTSKAGEAVYAWDFENRLVRVELAIGTVVEHHYDADGSRVLTRTTPLEGTATAMHFLVDTAGPLSHVVSESDEAGVLGTLYARAGDEIVALLRGSETRFYHADGLGSVRRLTDEAGASPDAYAFTAFGERLHHFGSDAQPYGFAGEPLDIASGLAYHRARWMAPAIGRFAVSDSFPGSTTDPVSLHRYLFAHGDPANRRDPSGLFSLTENAVVAAIRGILTAVFRAVAGPILRTARSIRNFFWRPMPAKLKLGTMTEKAATAAVRSEYAAAGRSVHHWLFPSRWKWIPWQIRNAGFNLLSMPNMTWLTRLLGPHSFGGLNQWMGMVLKHGNWRTVLAVGTEWGIKAAIPIAAYAAYEGGAALGDIVLDTFSIDEMDQHLEDCPNDVGEFEMEMLDQSDMDGPG
jgi:RHS repeat-associated protein